MRKIYSAIFIDSLFKNTNRRWILGLFVVLMLAISDATFASDFNGTWISVVPSVTCTGRSADYTLKATNAPDAGAGIAVGNKVVVTFPSGFNLSTITGGTMNSQTIGAITKGATTVSFDVPTNASVAAGGAITIVLNGIVNKSTLGNYSISMTIDNSTGTGIGNQNIFDGGAFTINPVITPNISISSDDADNSICAGGSITFTANSTSNVASPQYQWQVNGVNVGSNSSVNTFTISTNSLAPYTLYGTNPFVVTVVLTSAVTPCERATSSGTSVTVNAIPSAPTTAANFSVCAGSPISLSASTISNATYSWTGPNGFTSNQQNPTISSSTAATTGDYKVTATVLGCTSGEGKTTVTVNAIPSAPTTAANFSVCAGSPISLSASTISNATYSWTGPNGFTSNQQNPTISSSTAAMTGDYKVTATVLGCTSGEGKTTVTVNAIPAAPTTAANFSVCAGSPISLSASTISNATYSWTGPNGFTSNQQNPTISSSTAAMTGDYKVTATVLGCTSGEGKTTVTVNAIPSAPTTAANFSVCAGSPISLSASTISNATYSWTGPNGFTSNQQNPTISSSTAAMTGDYKVTATVLGCTSGEGKTTVTVNAIPAAPTTAANFSVCAGSPISLSASTISNATYSWTGPNGFTSNQQNPTISSSTAAMTGDYKVTATVLGCTSGEGKTTVTVNAIPSAPTTAANFSVCAGSPISLSASTISNATYSWTGPNGFTSNQQNPTISSSTAAMTGDYKVTATVLGCTSWEGKTTVTVNAIPCSANNGSEFFSMCRESD